MKPSKRNIANVHKLKEKLRGGRPSLSKYALKNRPQRAAK